MGRAQGFFGTVIAVALGACLIGAPAATAGGTSVTSKLTKKTVRLGNPTWITGRLSGHPGGNSGRALLLIENRFPYNSPTSPRTLYTDVNGNYSARLEPKLNTRYRVRLATDSTVVSPKRTAWVNPSRVGIRARFVNRRQSKVRAKMIMNVWRNHPYRFGGRKLFFYFHKVGTSRWRVIDRSRTRVRRPGKVRGSATFKIPVHRRPYRFEIGWCFNTSRRDVGVGRPQRKTCPRSFGRNRAARADVDKAPVRGVTPLRSRGRSARR